MAEPFRLIQPAAEAGPQALPHNVEAEAALLGALMIDNRLVEDVQLKLRADHFYDPVHGRIYDAILKLVDRNMLANPVTLRPMFEGDQGLKEVGGAGYLAQLTGSGAALIGARDFATQVYDLALLRALVGVGRDMVEKAVDTSDSVDPKAQIEQAEVALYKVAEEGGEQQGVKTFGQATKLAVQMAERALNSGGHVSGITTGLDSLNAKMGGLHPSDLIILAGRPGMGKSSLATNIAFNAAKRWVQDKEDGIDPAKSVGAPVVIFNLEMSSDQLATRILAEQSGISSENLRMGKISQHEFRNLARAAAELEELPLYIDDTPALTIAALRTRARRLKRQRGIRMIIVDYLQLLSGGSKGNGDANRVQEISEISRGLKQLAKELDVPVMALSQLSRAVEQREDKRPQLSDLRESGSIEQDADIVLFIYREEYYLLPHEPSHPDPTDQLGIAKYQEWSDKLAPVRNTAEVIIGKQRHGATGKVKLRFESRITRFTDLAEDY